MPRLRGWPELEPRIVIGLEQDGVLPKRLIIDHILAPRTIQPNSMSSSES